MIGGHKGFVPDPLPPNNLVLDRFLPEMTPATHAVGYWKRCRWVRFRGYSYLGIRTCHRNPHRNPVHRNPVNSE